MRYFSQLIIILLFVSCYNEPQNSNSVEKQSDITASPDAIEFYKLKKVSIIDSKEIEISFQIPKESTSNLAQENELGRFETEYNLDETLIIGLRNLESQYTIRFDNASDYLKTVEEGISKKFGDDIQKISSMFPPSYQNVKSASVDYDLIINKHPYIRRTLYFNESVSSPLNTNFHFITWFKKKKYTFDVTYVGTGKNFTELIGLSNAIAGSLKFRTIN